MLAVFKFAKLPRSACTRMDTNSGQWLYMHRLQQLTSDAVYTLQLGSPVALLRRELLCTPSKLSSRLW